jgi:cold shock CspA family protein
VARPGPDPRQHPDATGRVTAILSGQGQGFIRLADERKVFFHRSDLEAGVSFRQLRLGTRVLFDLMDDPVSGPRALRLRLVDAGR